MGVIRQFLARLGSLPRRRALTGLAVLLVAAAVLFAAMLRSKPAEAETKPLPHPLAILDSRSPGARVAGALFQSKPRQAVVARTLRRPGVTLPRERVLAIGRTRPVAALAPAPAWPQTTAAFDGLPDGLAPVPDLGGSTAGPAFEVPPFAFGDAPPAAPDTPAPEGPGGPGPAVPEPATWLMMIVGLGVIGQALRSGSARSAGAPGG